MNFDDRRADLGGGLDLRRLGAMNNDTRMPASVSCPTVPRKMSRWPAASRPPSVVRSSLRSGTMQAACGRTLQAMPTISGVAAISRLSGFAMRSWRRRYHHQQCDGDPRADAR